MGPLFRNCFSAFHRSLSDRKISVVVSYINTKVTLPISFTLGKLCYLAVRWMRQYLEAADYTVHTAWAGADQTPPKAFISSKLSNHHFSTSRPECMASPALPGLCVCISATLFWDFMPHTISKPPLSAVFFPSLPPLCFLHTAAGFRCPMYYGWEN